jgi:hypothetical protein
VRAYRSEEEADADKSPPALCGICGKKKLRQKAIGKSLASPEAKEVVNVLLRNL